MPDFRIKGPALQLFVNNKFICNIDSVTINQNSKMFNKELGKSNYGTVINIKKEDPPTPEEKKAQEEIAKGESYDEFFKRMVDIPEVHDPIDW